ncbi:unnamed protein product [Adineta steineri]|uniref:Uncharacterized protein n=2 Tax=Adineta steineri TaxID=433720 RepID=A0A814ABB4_9BILA|nr:unnamed protein product [Adineta steineri]
MYSVKFVGIITQVGLHVYLLGETNYGSITTSQLKTIMPQCKHLAYLNNINRAIEEGLINSCAGKSAFLAKIALKLDFERVYGFGKSTN